MLKGYVNENALLDNDNGFMVLWTCRRRHVQLENTFKIMP